MRGFRMNTHTQQLIRMIRAYKERNPQEKNVALASILSDLRQESEIFSSSRSTEKKEIGAFVLLFSESFREVLCMWHTTIGGWAFPGGRYDGNTDIRASAVASIKQETGIQGVALLSHIPLHIHRFDHPTQAYGCEKTTYGIFFHALAPEGQWPRVMDSHKCAEIRWFTREALATLIKDDPYGMYESILKKWNMVANTT